MTDTKVCKNCIHKNLCSARRTYNDVMNEWNSQFPYIQMNQDGDVLAENCDEYKSLSDIHIIEKEKDKKSVFGK